MDMSNFRPELHVAQQSRRDKLRIQHESNGPHHNIEVYINNLEQQQHHGLNNYESAIPRTFRPGSICYNPSEICPEVLNFPPENQEPDKRAPFENFYREIPTADVSNDPQYFNTWKTVGSQSTTTDNNWVPNDNNNTQSPIFVGARMSTLDNVKPYLGYQDNHNMHCTSSSLYQNALQELVTSSNVRPFGFESASFRQMGPQDTRALSLSLSSVPSPRVHATQIADHIQETVTWKPEFSTAGGSNLASASTHRNPGPLGPFTGYSTILGNSKFLRSAEQLLDEHCCGSRHKNVDVCEVSNKISEVVRVSVGDLENDLDGVGGSSFAFNGSNDSYQPESLQKKAKLMYMQDEVCKKYKQYHQQIQMVVSSFESVAGLSAATPYVSLALKTVSKHFRCLKNAITDQLKSMRNALGEELMSPSVDTRSIKGDAGGSMLKFFDHGFNKQKGTAGGLGILESQHIWRPQRGLPERSVSILRAWLFDHFLHPYPTDTDKHMLATQTGLTRNQVSNWFINARVRVWKPMVEEIHMLETKGVSETGSGVLLNAPKTTNHNEGFDQSNESSNQPLNRLKMSSIIDKQMVEYSSAEQEDAVGSNVNVWNQEKRSRVEYHVPSGPTPDGSMMEYSLMMPPHRSGPEMGGLGSVSLTLGLRQSAESGQRSRFGGQIIRDYVG
ncbi:PREDICTED: BEL1-like homeodomain protein 8 [Erythranthe guttata]|uniref:BEL1-like homeodomain protein 8 n=1 Tax=Erythranthe guttata TaxID=4155 RepID=UPI00064DC342|nr:PREDICTED: BEL1-like homeodomain protein 8 [Erythranthe guttata]|eukprot:XP_012827886.1 PREDICTED: BEL1-like homeodomain protein 8 [Erythranthe guttata]